MRNLKRALSLGLASAMVLGTMAFSASAATSTSVTPTEVTTSYSDNDSIREDNVNAVYIAEQIGLMTGKDGGIFEPEATVTRMEMAVICVNMKFGVDYASANFVEGDDANPVFADLTWGYEFAKVAAQEGIIYGTGTNAAGEMLFNPDGKVIAADALLMILKTLGYFKNPAQEFSVDYKYAAGALATELSLYDEKEYALVVELSREEVAAVAIRALTECARVGYNYETGSYYNDSQGYNSAQLPNNNIIEDTLGYQKFALKAVDSIDSFNRPTKLWTVKSQEVANFVEDVHTAADGSAMEYTTAKTFQEIAKELSNVTKESNAEYYEYGIYVDGMEYSEWMYAFGHHEDQIASTETLEGFNAVMDPQNTGHFTPSNNGVLTQVFVVDKLDYFDGQGNYVEIPGKVYVSCVNTYLAEVKYSTDHDTGEYTTRVSFFGNVLANSKKENTGLEVSKGMEFTVDTNEEFVSGDIVAIQATARDLLAAGYDKDIDGSMKIIHISNPEIAEGTVTSSKLSTDYVGGSWLTIDEGETYEYSIGMRGDINSNDEEDMSPKPGAEVVVYLDDNIGPDGNPYVLGYSAVETAPQYLYVEESDGDGWNFYTGSTAKVTFADGEERVIEISHIDGEAVSALNHGKIPVGSRYLDSEDRIVSANENFVHKADGSFEITNAQIENRIFGYTYLPETETYDISTVIQDPYSYEDGAKEGGMLQMSNKYGAEGTDINGHGTLLLEANGNISLDGTPVKDTMAIFTSVYMPNKVDAATAIKLSDDGKEAETMAAYNTTVANPNNVVKDADGTPITFKNDGGSMDGHTQYWNFAMQGDNTAAFAMESPKTGTTTYFQLDNDDLYGSVADGDTIDGKAYSDKNAAQFGQYDHMFYVNEDTVFVDVVNNDWWKGYNNSDLPDMKNGDLNMQVVFGSSGIADTVFINNGIEDDLSEGDYFIITDDQPVVTVVDGITIYTYPCYVDGVLTSFDTKTKQVVVTNEHDLAEHGDDKISKLQINTLYRISSKDSDGFVREVDLKYDYSPITDTLYSETDMKDLYEKTEGVSHEVYNNLWSVASKVSGGLLTLMNDDQFLENGEPDAGIFDTDGIPGEDVYAYNSDTVFVVLEANKSGDIKNIYAGDHTDIEVYDDDYSIFSWVDVVTVNNKDHRNPTAELVVVLQPWPADAVYDKVEGEFDVNVKKAGESTNVNGTGAENNPYQLYVEFKGEVPTDKDDLNSLRQSAMAQYANEFTSGGYTYELKTFKETDEYTTWVMYRYNSSGAVISENYYTLHNDDITAHYKYAVVDSTNGAELDDLITMDLFGAAISNQTELENILAAPNTKDDITYDLTVEDLYDLLVADEVPYIGDFISLTHTGVVTGSADNTPYYIARDTFMAMELWEFFVITDGAIGAVKYDSQTPSNFNLIRMIVDTAGLDLLVTEGGATARHAQLNSTLPDSSGTDAVTGNTHAKEYYITASDTNATTEESFQLTLTLKGADLVSTSETSESTITVTGATIKESGSEFTNTDTVATLGGLASESKDVSAGQTIIYTVAANSTVKFAVKHAAAETITVKVNGVNTDVPKYSTIGGLKTAVSSMSGDGVAIVDGALVNLNGNNTPLVDGTTEIITESKLKAITLPAGMTVGTGSNHADSENKAVVSGEVWHDASTTLYILETATATAIKVTPGGDCAYVNAFVVDNAAVGFYKEEDGILVAHATEGDVTLPISTLANGDTIVGVMKIATAGSAGIITVSDATGAEDLGTISTADAYARYVVPGITVSGTETKGTGAGSVYTITVNDEAKNPTQGDNYVIGADANIGTGDPATNAELIRYAVTDATTFATSGIVITGDDGL